MAKVIFSPALSDAAKSIGGISFTHGPFGPMMIVKQRPVQSESNAQLGIRASFSALTKRWATVLTQAQQAGWIAFAAAHQVHDTLGQLITLTGVQTYVKLNGALKAALQATIDTAPAAVATGAPGALTIVAQAAGPPTLTVSPAVNPAAGEVPIVWSMHPITIGTHQVKKRLISIFVGTPGQAGPYDVLAGWNQRWGAFQTGTVIVCQLQYTDSATGWQGTASLDIAIST